MPIVIPRNGELAPNATPAIPQDLRDRIWAAFVTSWLDNHQDEFQTMLAQPTGQA